MSTTPEGIRAQLDRAVTGWVINSLKEEGARLRGRAHHVRRRFRKGPFVDAAAIVADAYERAAMVLGQTLNDVRALKAEETQR